MNFDLEENILGSLLLKPDLMQKTVITEEYFLDELNAFIFKLFKMQYEDAKTITVVGLAENYKTYFNSKFTSSKVTEKLTEFMNDVPLATNFDYYQQSLFEKYIENKIMRSIQDFNSNKISKQELFDLIHNYESMGIKTKDDKYSSEEIFKLISSNNKDIKFRFSKISDVANIQEHDLCVIAARPGIGKSGFALNLLEDISDKYNCIFFNMEMSEKQMYQRLISINSGTPMNQLNDIKTEYQLGKIKESCQSISKKKIKIFNNAQTIANIRRIIINESKKEHTVVFIDHVGLIIPQKRISSYEDVTSIVKEIRQISLNYNCTIFLVSQLSRKADEESVPKLTDLRDSGELEQSATTVIFLHDEEFNNNLTKDVIDLTFIIAKNRNGSKGQTKYTYNKKNQRFNQRRDDFYGKNK